MQALSAGGISNQSASTRQTDRTAAGDIHLGTYMGGTNDILDRSIIQFFHDVKDIRPVFEKVSLSLKEDGHFIFSVEHPICTSLLRGSCSSSVMFLCHILEVSVQFAGGY